MRGGGRRRGGGGGEKERKRKSEEKTIEKKSATCRAVCILYLGISASEASLYQYCLVIYLLFFSCMRSSSTAYNTGLFVCWLVA